MILLTSTDSGVSAVIKAASVHHLNHHQAAAVCIVLYLARGKPWSVVLLVCLRTACLHASVCCVCSGITNRDVSVVTALSTLLVTSTATPSHVDLCPLIRLHYTTHTHIPSHTLLKVENVLTDST